MVEIAVTELCTAINPSCDKVLLHSQAALGKYCVYLLADYITVAAAPRLDSSSAAAFFAAAATREALAGPAATALRQGALALYGACSPAEVSH